MFASPASSPQFKAFPPLDGVFHWIRIQAMHAPAVGSSLLQLYGPLLAIQLLSLPTGRISYSYRSSNNRTGHTKDVLHLYRLFDIEVIPSNCANRSWTGSKQWRTDFDDLLTPRPR